MSKSPLAAKLKLGARTLLRLSNLSPDANEGLNIVIKELQDKNEFFEEVKAPNRNVNHKLDSARDVYRKFADNSLSCQNVPIPVLLKIKHGIMRLPANYTVTEGVAFAMKSSLEAMQDLESRELHKIILNKNNITDRSFATILKGLSKRAEFTSLITKGNEIGLRAAKELVGMLAKDPIDPRNLPIGDKEKKAEEAPAVVDEEPVSQRSTFNQVTELRIRSSKIAPKAIDMIIAQLYAPTCCLRRLALSDLWLSERQQKTLIGSLKESQLVELDLSWNKM